MSFPATRLRRFRQTPALRRLVRETRLSARQPGPPPVRLSRARASPSPSAPCPASSSSRSTRSSRPAAQAFAEGIRTVLLFGIPEHKDEIGSASWSPDGIVQRAMRALSAEVPGLVKIADVCFCEYTEPRPLRRAQGARRWTTTPPWRTWRGSRSPWPRPGRTSSRRRT